MDGDNEKSALDLCNYLHLNHFFSKFLKQTSAINFIKTEDRLVKHSISWQNGNMFAQFFLKGPVEMNGHLLIVKCFFPFISASNPIPGV